MYFNAIYVCIYIVKYIYVGNLFCLESPCFEKCEMLLKVHVLDVSFAVEVAKPAEMDLLACAYICSFICMNLFM